MRTNLPITQQEWVLRDGTTIVSKTDLKGRISYVNDDFIEASGYTEAELMGEPHNLVRHPDMPEEAFSDLWVTLKQGKPWTGLVKNRRKNGDYYWVMANATPMLEGGSVVGYMSVRSKPERAQVEAAEAAYRLFKQGAARGLAIRDGRVVRTGVRDWLNVSHRATLTQKFMLALSPLLAALVLLLAGLALPEAMASWHTGAVALVAALLLCGGALGLLFIRSLAKSLRALSFQTNELAQGRFEKIFDAAGNDEIADVRRALQALRTRLGFELSDTRRAADIASRIQTALDNVATNVMVADRDCNIIYMNRAIGEMFRNAEADIRKDLPQFQAGALLGASIDSFHKNPAHQRQMLERLSGSHRATVKLGGRTFALTVTPVNNAKGQRLGTAVEWVDRTNEVAVETEVAGIVEAAAGGDFGKRIEVSGKSGFFAQLAGAVNTLL
ncbi:MAG: PAS domain-containing protein, partial [Burkholderiales bacterium]|nr:PAS domain-containing protein [Burkholderiales bacterium]